MDRSFQFFSEEILFTNIQRTISISFFLTTERYTGFDASFFEDEYYTLFIDFFNTPGLVEISRVPSFWMIFKIYFSG